MNIKKRLLHLKIFKSTLLSLRTKGKMLIYRKAKVNIHKTAKIKIKNRFEIGYAWDGCAYNPSTLLLKKGAKLNVNGAFRILNDCFITVGENAILELGNGYINNKANISCYNKISIGDNVIISEDVIIRDSDNHNIHYEGYEQTKSITIEDNVWIGIRVTILKGVTIGSGSVIAAGSIVTKDVPPNCLVAGIPAKIIKRDIKWS